LGPCRKLEIQNPIETAKALMNLLLLTRSPQLTRAVFQSAHSLFVPVKLGIEFVAQTQAVSWSIQHILCNFECAFLLSKFTALLVTLLSSPNTGKWLETVANSDQNLSDEESMLLEMVRSMVLETKLSTILQSEDQGAQMNDKVKIKQLAAAVM
jgi:hypothetical protein